MPTCRQCSSSYEWSISDQRLLEKLFPIVAGNPIPLPPPALCPTCRLQRRMLWRGELHLFKRKSAYSGNDIMTFIPPSANCNVYAPLEWWSDKWDALNYGRDFDFNRPFFEQFAELITEVPLLGLTVSENENSDYINCASWNKNCYLLAGANHNENCYYGNYVNYSTSCVDVSFIDHCELCYECVDCIGCYALRYGRNCENCYDCAYLCNCRGCRNCFGCVNLVNKEFYFRNQSLSKSRYEEELCKLKLHTRVGVAAEWKAFTEFRYTFPHRFYLGIMNDDVSGNSILKSRRAHNCYDVSNVEDCRNCVWFHKARDCMDIFAWGFPAELCYQCTEVGDGSYGTLFTVTSWGCRRVMYSFMVARSQDCFGCIGVQNQQYCILNKQYSKPDYEKLVLRMTKHMQKTGEWGEFFPPQLSPLSYNTAVTSDYFPLEHEEAKAFGSKWHDEPQPIEPAHPFLIPNNIDEVDESICSQVLSCKDTAKAFKITLPEFRFYKKQHIPIPDICFWARHKRRLKQRNPRQLWHRNCAKCGTPIATSYSPEAPEKVYCERCYVEAVE